MRKMASMVLCCLAVVSASMLGGCTTAVQQAAIDEQQCQSYGFVSGTQTFAQCRMTLDVQRQQARMAAGAAVADALQGVSDNYAHAAATSSYQATQAGMTPACADGYACAGRTLQGDGNWH